MPKKENQEFNKEEFVNKLKQAVFSEPWGAAVLYDSGTVRLEVVRIEESDNVMVRLAGQKPGNALKLTTKEHIYDVMEIFKALFNNEDNLRDKLEAVMELLPERKQGRRVVL